MTKDMKFELVDQCEILFARMCLHFGETEARNLWAVVAKRRQGTGKAATREYVRLLNAMWIAAKQFPQASQGQLIRDAASVMNERLGNRATSSRERQLERKWPAYRRMREEQEEKHRQALAKALVMPATPLARSLWELGGLGPASNPPSEKRGN